MGHRGKRAARSIICILLMALTGTAGPMARAQTARVKPYTVSPTLREVINLRAFNRATPLSPQQRRMIAQNLFAVSPTSAKQLFHIYEENDYRNIPSFVTSDAVLHLYHIFYDFTLRTVEEKTLTPVLERLTEKMLAQSVITWKEASDPQLKQAALKNVVYFGVAARYIQTTIERDTARYILLARIGQLLPALGIAPAQETGR